MRIRSIKPEFFGDEEIASLPPLVRLLFQGLWCMADREGRLEDRPVRIKAHVLPYDECDMSEMLTTLAQHSFIQRYEANGRKYIQIRTFSKNQRPHHREAESSLPAPSIKKDTGRGRVKPGRGTAQPAGSGKGREGNGHGKGMDVPPTPSALAVREKAWSAEAVDDWRAGTGGEPRGGDEASGGRIGKALKPLVERVARDKALDFEDAWKLMRPWWRKFCDSDNSRFGPEYFATNPRAALGIGSAKPQERGLSTMLEALESE